MSNQTNVAAKVLSGRGSQDDRALIINPELEAYLCPEHDQALATVVSVWSSAPHPPGSQMLIIKDQHQEQASFHGAVSGGCIEAAVVAEAEAIFQERTPVGRLLQYGVSDHDAFMYGLACGGTITVWLETITKRDTILVSPQSARIVELFSGATVCSGQREAVFAEFGQYHKDKREGSIDQPILSLAGDTLADHASLPSPVSGYLYHPALRTWHLVVVGASTLGIHLTMLALLSGAKVTLIDPRPGFIAAPRLSLAQHISESTGGQFQTIMAYPDEALSADQLTRDSAVVTVSHDPKIDDPALRLALSTPASYIGALGSKRSHQARVARLAAYDLSRVFAPVGATTGLKSRAPAEIALAVITEWIRYRSG